MSRLSLLLAWQWLGEALTRSTSATRLRSFLAAPLPASVAVVALWAAALLAPGTAFADGASGGIQFSLTSMEAVFFSMIGVTTFGAAVIWLAKHFGKQAGNAASSAVDKAAAMVNDDLAKNAWLASHPADLATLQQVVFFVAGIVKSTVIETLTDVASQTELDWKKVAKDSLSTAMGQINQPAILAILQKAGVLAPGASLETWLRSLIANVLHDIAANKGGLLGHLLDDAADEVAPPAPTPGAAGAARGVGAISQAPAPAAAPKPKAVPAPTTTEDGKASPALALVLMLVGSLAFGCGHLQWTGGETQQVVDCGASDVLAAMPTVAVDVMLALTGTNVNWSSVLDDLEQKAPGAAVCVVQTVITDYEQGMNTVDGGASFATLNAKPKATQVLARAYSWMQSRHVKLAHPPVVTH